MPVEHPDQILPITDDKMQALINLGVSRDLTSYEAVMRIYKLYEATAGQLDPPVRIYFLDAINSINNFLLP